MSGTPKKKNLSSIIVISVICLLTAALLYVFRYNFLPKFNSAFPPSAEKSLGLTEEEKIEDFNFLFETAAAGMPMIDEYSSVYGFNFKDKREYYLNMVKSTTSDYEFFCVMSAISQELPGFHTDLVYPANIGTLQCYNSKQLLSDRSVLAHNSYWTKLLEEKESDEQYLVFTYVDGNYIFNSFESDAENMYDSTQLVEIDGVSVDDYVTEKIFFYNLYYDGAHSKPCRTKIVFNDRSGERLSVKLKSVDGTVFDTELYYSLYSETAFCIRSSDKPEQEYQDYFIYEADDYAYVAVNNMSNSYGEKIRAKLRKLKSDNIILDLRENYGGNPSYAAEYIYQPLFADDVIESNYWYMPVSDANLTISEYWLNKLMIGFETAEDYPYNAENMLRSEVSQRYVGKAKKNRNVIILTSQRTGSAADRFSSDMQKNGLAEIVGNNTGGEGLAYTFNAVSLPNSKLVFIYMPGGAKNPDGSDNSAVGTKADMYISMSQEDFLLYNDMLENGEDTSSYESKLKYDTVLKYSINYFEE